MQICIQYYVLKKCHRIHYVETGVFIHDQSGRVISLLITFNGNYCHSYIDKKSIQISGYFLNKLHENSAFETSISSGK